MSPCPVVRTGEETNVGLELTWGDGFNGVGSHTRVLGGNDRIGIIPIGQHSDRALRVHLREAFDSTLDISGMFQIRSKAAEGALIGAPHLLEVVHLTLEISHALADAAALGCRPVFLRLVHYFDPITPTQTRNEAGEIARLSPTWIRDQRSAWRSLRPSKKRAMDTPPGIDRYRIT
jgi:hypothetical protein